VEIPEPKVKIVQAQAPPDRIVQLRKQTTIKPDYRFTILACMVCSLLTCVTTLAVGRYMMPKSMTDPLADVMEGMGPEYAQSRQRVDSYRLAATQKLMAERRAELERLKEAVKAQEAQNNGKDASRSGDS
jgi:hypothetical protein